MGVACGKNNRTPKRCARRSCASKQGRRDADSSQMASKSAAAPCPDAANAHARLARLCGLKSPSRLEREREKRKKSGAM